MPPKCNKSAKETRRRVGKRVAAGGGKVTGRIIFRPRKGYGCKWLTVSRRLPQATIKKWEIAGSVPVGEGAGDRSAASALEASGGGFCTPLNSK